MRERITVEPTSGINPHEVEIKTTESIDQGGYREKKRHGVLVHVGEGSRKIQLVERPDDLGYSARWAALKEAGFPVVPTLRKTGEGTVLITDVAKDGTEVFGKSLSVLLQELEDSIPEEDAHEASKKDAEMLERVTRVKAFLELTQGEQLEKIKKQVHEYTQRANEKGILLPVDGQFELLVHPDGTWSLMLLDLDKEKELEDHVTTPEEIVYQNNLNEQYFSTIMEEIRRGLLAIQGRARKSS